MADAADATAVNQRPLAVTILSWLFIAAGAVGLVYHASALPDENGVVAASVLLLIRALAIIGGGFALRGANWSRWLLLAWAGFHVVISLSELSSGVAHTVLLIVVWYVYFRSPASAWFRRDVGVS